MAFLATLTSTHITVASYRKTVTVNYDLTGITAASDEVVIPFPYHGNVTLLELVQADLGPAVTFDPRVGTAAAYADGSIDDAWTNGAGAAHIRAVPGPVASEDGVLAVRPVASGNCDATLRVTWTEGHAA